MPFMECNEKWFSLHPIHRDIRLIRYEPVETNRDTSFPKGRDLARFAF